MPDRKTAPAIKESVDYEINLPDHQFYTLKNGAPVYFIDGGAEEVAKIEWVFHAGNFFEKKNGVAAATARLIQNGTSKKTAFEISRHFEFYGAHINCVCYNEYAVISLHCLSKYLKELLPVVYELLTDAVFPQEEIVIYKQQKIQWLKVQLQKSEFVATRQIDANLYGDDNPYGRKTNKEDIESLSREDLMDFYKNFYKTACCRVFAAGKLPGSFTKMMDEYFGELDINHTIAFPIFERHLSAEKKMRITNDPDGVQSAIRMARPFPTRDDPDFKPASVLNTVFGGYFGSRLMTNIREEKGYTYGIYSYIQTHLQGSSWMISTEAGKDVSEDTISEVYKEMELLRNELIDQEELMLVRNYLIGRQLAFLDGPFKIIEWWKILILNNLDKQYYTDTINTIKTVTAEELQAIAQKYFVPEDFYEVAVV